MPSFSQKQCAMKKLSLLLLLLLVLGCKKDTTAPVDLDKLDYFIFGRASGFCVGSSCVMLYKLENQQLFPDADMTYTQFSTGDIAFGTTSLPTDKVLLAQALLAEFPSSLLNEPNGTLGCPDCTDQGVYYIKMKSGKTVREWHIDPFLDQYHPFCNAISITLSQLK